MVALLDALVSPQHDLSLARALRSPLFSLGDDDLVQLALACGRRGSAWARAPPTRWYDLLQNEELLTPELQGLAPDPRALERLAGQPAAARRAARRSTTTATCSRALRTRHRPRCAAQRAGQPARAARRVAGTGRRPLRHALCFCARLQGRRHAGAGHRQQRGGAPLTIHGAKGLEADCRAAAGHRHACERNADSHGRAGRLARRGDRCRASLSSSVSESRPPACAGEALAAEQAARKREELNALYVALTRARQPGGVVRRAAPHERNEVAPAIGAVVR